MGVQMAYGEILPCSDWGKNSSVHRRRGDGEGKNVYGQMPLDPGGPGSLYRLTVADCTGMIPILDLRRVHGEL